jgi:hypothetical protein
MSFSYVAFFLFPAIQECMVVAIVMLEKALLPVLDAMDLK